MSNMITIEEAIQSNNKVIGICFLVFILASFVAWVFTIRRERRVKKLIRRAVAKAEARAAEEAKGTIHDQSLDNFIRWMEARRELRQAKDELQEARDEAADYRRKYELLSKSAAGCPGVTRAKIIEN